MSGSQSPQPWRVVLTIGLVACVIAPFACNRTKNKEVAEVEELDAITVGDMAGTGSGVGKGEGTSRVHTRMGKAVRPGMPGMPGLPGMPGGPNMPGQVVVAPIQIAPLLHGAGIQGKAPDLPVENPFISVSQAPLSTFSSDVDTASYTILRKQILDGKLPPRSMVRIEEMVNYFNYAYPPPADEHPVAVYPELTNCPWKPEHRLLRVGVQSKFVSTGAMPPRNFVFLCDVSGSMQPENRLPLLKKSLALLVEQLSAQDRVAIVVYAGNAGLVLPSTPGDRMDEILKSLNDLEAGGSTNGGQGLQLAYKIAKENFIPGGLNRVIIGTDGDFNVGTTSDEGLVHLIEEQRKEGVFLTVVGFGMDNLRDAMLEKLAHHGNGHYAYIDTLEESRKLFVDQGAALVMVAKDVKFQIEFNTKHVAAYRLIGYENRLLRNEDFANDQKDAGDLGSGHTVTVLYELVPHGVAVPEADPNAKPGQKSKPSGVLHDDEWLRVNLRYKQPELDTSELLSVPVRHGDLRIAPTPDTQFAAAVAEFGMLLRDSKYKGAATFGSALELARNGQNGPRNEYRGEFIDLLKRAETLFPAK